MVQFRFVFFYRSTFVLNPIPQSTKRSISTFFRTWDQAKEKKVKRCWFFFWSLLPTLYVQNVYDMLSSIRILDIAAVVAIVIPLNTLDKQGTILADNVSGIAVKKKGKHEKKLNEREIGRISIQFSRDEKKKENFLFLQLTRINNQGFFPSFWQEQGHAIK